MTYAIRAAGLGKRYRVIRDASAVRQPRPPASTLVEEISRAASGIRSRLRGLQPPATDDFWALRDAGFEVAPGEAVGLIGPNGSGKTTLLKILARVTEPSEGLMRLRGRTASLLEVGVGFHPDLSARQNIFLNGAILGMRRKEIAAQLDQIVEFAGIEGFLAEPVRHLSSGLYMRLAFAVAAFLESEILLVDEVLAVGDAVFQEKCLRTLRDASGRGRTIVLVSHNMTAISQLTARSLVLEKGHIVYDGPTLGAIARHVARKEGQIYRGRRPTAEIACQRRFRRDAALFIKEMGLADAQPAEIRSGDSVRMEFLIAAQGVHRDLRFAYSINSVTGQPLLTGLSPVFTVGAGRQQVELEIAAVFLAPGEYDFSINLGVGGLDAVKLECDSYMGFGRLSVARATADGGVFGEWQSEWGAVVHRQSQVRLRP